MRRERWMSRTIRISPRQRPNHRCCSAVPAEQAVLWPWAAEHSAAGTSTLIGFGLWLHARRQPVQRALQPGPTPRSLLDDLRRACQANDTQATRQALDAWARQQPETLADMAARFVPLSDALDGLNGALYRSRPTLAGRCVVAGDPGAATGQQPGSRPGTGCIAAALSTLMAVFGRHWRTPVTARGMHHFLAGIWLASGLA